MARFPWLAPLLLALVVAWLAGGGNGCSRQPSPQLVQVLDLTPRQVEAGEHVVLVGAGFPPGKPARVTFRGTLHRPGERPVRGAEIPVSGMVVGPEQIEMAFGEPVQALFCGAGDRAVHTTFEGDVEVGFAAALPGAPPVVGMLQHVTLDVHPDGARRDDEAEQEGLRALGWLGLKGDEGPLGLTVRSVEPGSRAVSAGLAEGDVVASFDGVHVGAVGDMVPAPGEREATLGVRRAGAAVESVLLLPVDGFRRAPPTELIGAALVVLAALAAVLLFAAPARPSIAAQLQRIVSRLRARAGNAGLARRSAVASLGRALGAATLGALPPAGAPALVDGVICALLAVMPFGQYLVASQLDVGLLFVGAATALAVAALVAGGSAWSGARAALHVAWQHVPAALVVSSVVVSTGSLRVQEIERAQGGWPWDWLAFRSPAGLVALVLLLACARVEPDAPVRGDSQGLAARVEPSSPAPSSPARAKQRGRWLAAACRAHRLVIVGLASTLLLGGWLLPGLPAAAQVGHLGLELAGAAWLLAKTWGLVVVLAWSRDALPAPSLADRTRRTALALVPLSAVVLGVSVGWTWWGPGGAVQLLVSGALVAGMSLAAVALVRRVHHGLLAPDGDGRLSPFL